jgi:hypothetical protein
MPPHGSRNPFHGAERQLMEVDQDGLFKGFLKQDKCEQFERNDLSFYDIPESEINDTLNFLEVIDVPGDYSSTDLASQKRDTNIIVLSWISRVQLSNGSELLAGTADSDLSGGVRRNQTAQFDENISETYQVIYFCFAFRAHPQFMQHRVDKIGDCVKPVNFAGKLAPVEDADINIGIKYNFFLHRYISSKSKVPAPLKVASANWISVSN